MQEYGVITMKYLTQDKGFSLIEVLVATTIFAVGLLAVASMQLTSVTGNFSARSATESVFLAQEKAEELFSLPYNHNDLISDWDGDGNIEIELVEDLDGDGVIEGDDVHAQIVTSVDGNYTYRWVISDEIALTNTKTITLDVQYSRGSQNKQTRMIFAKADVL